MITKGSVTQFDVFGSGVGAQIFVVILSNSGDANLHTGLRLRYRVEYSQQGAGTTKRLYEGLSNIFIMSPGENVPPISSTDFLKKNNPAVKVSLITTVYELSDTDPLKKQFLNTQTIPDGKIKYILILEKNGVVHTTEFSEHTVINSTNVELISPGSSPSGTIVTVFDPHPMFLWTSDLPPYVYGPSDVFQIRIYKAQSGESVAQAMSRIPVIRTGVKELQYKEPDAGYQFIPGATYYWEVIGFVKGITTTEVKSSPYGFKMSKPLNPAVQEVVNTLKQVYGEEILQEIYEYDSDVSMKIDGRTIAINELKDIVQRILSGEYSIQSTTVE